jgi:hypothetical protein
MHPIETVTEFVIPCLRLGLKGIEHNFAMLKERTEKKLVKKLMFMCLLAALAIGMAFAQKEIAMPTEKGNVTLLMQDLTPDRFGHASLVATVRNNTPFKIDFLEFELVGYNASNVDIKVCGTTIGCRFLVFDAITPGSSVRLRPPGEEITLRETLRTNEIARTEFRVVEMTYFIKYDIQSTPVVNDKFAIVPMFTVNGIGLEFRNTSNDVIEVAWDQSVYIDEDGNSSRLIKGNVNFAEKDRSQPNTVIPPGTKLQETVFPVDRIRQVSGKWKQVPILPETAHIIDPQVARQRSLDRASRRMPEPDIYRPGMKDLTGKEMRLFLRLLVNDQKQTVTIPFKIADMVQ